MNRKIKTLNGFTLAELLIVVAIIGVLVAVSIPMFTSKLEKSREATDIANVRNAYALVKAAAISGEAGEKEVNVDAKGTYFILVPLKQKREDWQTENINIGGIQPADTQHWREKPLPDGTCKVTCSAEGETIFYWNGGSGYTPATVADNAKDLKPAIDAVLSTIYDSIVADRLNDPNNHISYLILKNGKVSEIGCYKDEADAMGQGNPGLTSSDYDALNEKITQALKESKYRLANNKTGYVFFDWNGNVVNNSSDPRIGGQGTSGTLTFFPESGNTQNTVNNRTGEWSR